MTKPRATPGTPPTGGGAAPRDFQDHLRASPSRTSPPLAQTLKDLGDVDDERVVLLPVDGGRGIETDAVLKWCCDNLYRDGDTFLLLHVVPRSGWRRRAREDALGYEPSEVSSVVVVVVVFPRETYPRPIRGAFSLAPSEEPGWGAILPKSAASPEEEKPKAKNQKPKLFTASGPPSHRRTPRTTRPPPCGWTRPRRACDASTSRAFSSLDSRRTSRASRVSRVGFFLSVNPDTPTPIVAVTAYDTACAKVGELVCEVAAATNAACVAMARHGKGTLRELVTGSVTNYCVHHCGSPVVVINVAAELSAREAAVGDRECAEFAWVP